MIIPALVLSVFAATIAGTPIIYDGRTPLSFTKGDLDVSADPYLTGVKGSENASHYSIPVGRSIPPTPLWNKNLISPSLMIPTEQTILVTIDNSSVFTPGSSTPQFGFRRTELIAQKNGDHASLNSLMEVGRTAFHISIMMDVKHPLNYNHEYQIVFIEPSDGTHVFGIQLGSPFTNPTGPLPVPNAHYFKVLDHALNVLFTTPFFPNIWHNFAVLVDWDKRTLEVFNSEGGSPLKAVSKVMSNPTTAAGPAGQGDFHFGVLKLPLVSANDSPADQGNVVHHGIQEGTTEGLFYSGVFVEAVTDGFSAGNGLVKKLDV